MNQKQNLSLSLAKCEMAGEAATTFSLYFHHCDDGRERETVVGTEQPP